MTGTFTYDALNGTITVLANDIGGVAFDRRLFLDSNHDFTLPVSALVRDTAIIGGVPDFKKIGPMCRQHPGDFACQLLAKSESPAAAPASVAVIDLRIKAAVVAAPALGFTFSPDGLKNVKVPVQLWRAENDVIVPHPRYAEAVRLALPRAPDYHVVPNAGHYDFLAPCSDALASLASAICTSSAGFDRAAFHVGFDSEVVKFFEKTLKNH